MFEKCEIFSFQKEVEERRWVKSIKKTNKRSHEANFLLQFDMKVAVTLVNASFQCFVLYSYCFPIDCFIVYGLSNCLLPNILPIVDFGLSSIDYRLLTIEYLLSTIIYRLSDYWLSTIDYRLPTTGCRLSTIDYPISTFNYQRSTCIDYRLLNFQQSTNQLCAIYYRLTSIDYRFSTIDCQL